jgi:amino acid adenylation domain-containing protein
MLKSAASRDEQSGAATLVTVPVKDSKRLTATETSEWPLSVAQQRLWLLHRLQPAQTAYNETRVLRICGPLNASALRDGFREIVRRHGILRTAILVRDGEPTQVVRPSFLFDLDVRDLRSHPADTLEAEWKRLACIEQRRPFDFEGDTLLRVMLLKLRRDEHVLLISMHHIVCDHWSIHNMWKELSELYAAALQGRPAELPDLPVSYGEYSRQQRQQLASPQGAEHLNYWSQQLAELPPLDLPHDFPRPASPSFRGARLPIALPRNLAAEVKALARRERGTPYMVLLAAFQTLMHRMSGQLDLAVGSPTAGRLSADTEPLIGFFINTLVLRANFAGTPTFREFLSQVRETTLAALQHQEVPFEKLVEVLSVARDLNRPPLVQVLFALQNGPALVLQFEGLTVELIDLDFGRGKFDLWLNLRVTADGWSGFVEYSSDLFEEATVRRLIGHYVTLLHGIVADPDCRLGELPLLTAAERQQLLVDGNNTRVSYPREKTIHERFDEQAVSTPEAIAIICGGQRLTYAELNARAERLARDLRTRGVGPDTLVGLCVERSIEMVVGMLGILKAGGAYVPLDPNDPPERLAFLRSDSQSRIVLERDDLDAINSADGSSRRCCENDLTGSLKQESVAAAAGRHATAESLAYVMYTSGSTGEPKGVCVTHRGVVRLVKRTNYVRLSANDRFLQYASPSFDASTFEIWGCLLNGGQLVLPPPGALSLDELGRLVRQHQITVLWLTAGVFHLMVEHGMDDLHSVRQLLAGGDVLSPAHVRRALEQLPNTTLINGYGPTENTTFSCCHAMTSADQVGETVSIGRPISNTQVYIVDLHMQPVPIGVHGELCVGGDGLARGYHRRPELTAEQFVPNPFGPPGSRLYKTGDVARYRADGTIEFIGRRDHQVKIRGHRVELAEIEAALRRHPAVRQCVVIAQTDDVGDKRLIGYVVPADASVAQDDLRRHVGEKLPSFMVPSHLMILDALPLTPHGKIDRQALPCPDAHVITAEVVAPRDPLELQLTKIWEDVLNVRPIGIRDTFFDLGGHSLLAVKLFDRIAKATGQTLPLATLFQCPTIEHLAGALRERNWSPAWQSLIPVQPGGSKPPLFLVPPAAGSVLRFAELAKHLGQDQPVYGLEPLGHDDRHRPLDRVEDMASWYLKEIRELQPTGPYRLAGICFGGLVAWEMALQLRQQGEDVSLVAMLDTGAPAFGPTWSPQTRPLTYFAWKVAEHLLAGTLLRTVRGAVRWRFRRLVLRWDSSGRRRLRMLNAHIKAQVSYSARPLADRVLLIQSEQNALGFLYHKRWAELARGEFEHVVVPRTTHRDLLLGTACTPTLARILREHLDRDLVEPESEDPCLLPFIRPADESDRIRLRRAA